MATRRATLIGVAALAASAAARRAGAATTGFSDQEYRRAIVIEGLGGVDDPYSPPEATVLDPRAVADLETSGLTMSHVTVNTVGNGMDVGWTSGQIEKALGANLMRLYAESFG